MEPAFAILCGVLFSAAVYLMLSRHIIRILLGVVLLGNAVNVLIFTMGRLTPDAPPIIPKDSPVPVGTVANALPQALILTAIVISFSFFAFLLVLAYRAFETLGIDDTSAMRVAEPEPAPAPPDGY